MSPSSDSRPWNILGRDGNNEKEFELEGSISRSEMRDFRFTYSVHVHPDIPASDLVSVGENTCVHTDDPSEMELVSESVEISSSICSC